MNFKPFFYFLLNYSILFISDDKFKLLDGDVMHSLLDGKFFTPNKINEKVMMDFKDANIVPTGLLCGREVYRARGKAQEIESAFDDTYIQEKGYRRDAIVYPKDVSVNYNKQTGKCKLKFTLPKLNAPIKLNDFLKQEFEGEK